MTAAVTGVNAATEAEAARNPLGTVRRCFQRASSTPAADGDWGVPAAFGDLFSPESYDRIPLLTAEAWRMGRLRPDSLVRYRGMVQDIFDPEFYVGVYEVSAGSLPKLYGSAKMAACLSIIATALRLR